MALKAAAGELDPAASPTLAALAQLAAEFPPLAEPGTAQPAAQQEAAGGEAGDEAEKAAHPGSGSKAAAAATKAALLGGTPFHPHMLSEVVNAFRPLGGSSTPVSANVVLGPGSGKPNGGLPLAVSRAGLPGMGLLPANPMLQQRICACSLPMVCRTRGTGGLRPTLPSAAGVPVARSVPYSASSSGQIRAVQRILLQPVMSRCRCSSLLLWLLAAPCCAAAVGAGGCTRLPGVPGGPHAPGAAGACSRRHR